MRYAVADLRRQATLGVVGGMGPLASAEFLKTIYECSIDTREQDAPIVLLYSDPTFPDRTEALLAGAHQALLDQLLVALNDLYARGVAEIVICCFTIHYFVPELPIHLRERVTSLIDVVFDALAEQPQPSLLICTTGTRELMLFQQHPRWPELQPWIVLPDAADQAEIHRLIYAIKRGDRLADAVEWLRVLLQKYACRSFIAGCTEIHLLAKYLAAHAPDLGICIDPLTIIAQRIAKDKTYDSETYS